MYVEIEDVNFLNIFINKTARFTSSLVFQRKTFEVLYVM